MTTSCVITEYECTDLWSLVQLGLDPHQDKDNPTGGTSRWFSPSSFLMLIYEMFYYECHNIALV
jgi:hypothetical protein